MGTENARESNQSFIYVNIYIHTIRMSEQRPEKQYWNDEFQNRHTTRSKWFNVLLYSDIQRLGVVNSRALGGFEFRPWSNFLHVARL
jgi:hypothetical protein